MLREQVPQPFDIISPIAVQFARRAKPTHQLRAGLGHAIPSRIARNRIERAGCVGDDENLIPLFQRRERRKRHANLGHHAGDDQLFLARGLYRLDEIFIIPGIDIAGTSNIGASGNVCFSSGTKGPFGPFSKLVVSIVGKLKYLARSASAKTLFLNLSGS